MKEEDLVSKAGWGRDDADQDGLAFSVRFLVSA